MRQLMHVIGLIARHLSESAVTQNVAATSSTVRTSHVADGGTFASGGLGPRSVAWSLILGSAQPAGPRALDEIAHRGHDLRRNLGGVSDDRHHDSAAPQRHDETQVRAP
jgi:hypothetical protein